MPYYHRSGRIPPKRHIRFYKEDKKSLYREELTSSLGFAGAYANKYHIHEPTRVLSITELPAQTLSEWSDAPLQYFHFFTDKVSQKGNFFTARCAFLYNAHCCVSTAQVSENTDMFFRNAYSHELIFVHRGQGDCLSEYGRLSFGEGDYILIPKGTTYQMVVSDAQNSKLFIVESDTPFDIPAKYKTTAGQLAEWAPYCERDFCPPAPVDPVDKQGKFTLILKAGRRQFQYELDHHPFDVVGWDGYLYPYLFNIKNFAPVVGQIHLPPPVHQVFQTQHFVVCNFVPRLFDFHPESIPAPYFHANVDSDEVLYYVDGNFMSREGITPGSITLHPAGVPHGPQPGKTEASIGKKETHELAIMIDTFSPLKLTHHVKASMDRTYAQSWLTS